MGFKKKEDIRIVPEPYFKKSKIYYKLSEVVEAASNLYKDKLFAKARDPELIQIRAAFAQVANEITCSKYSKIGKSINKDRNTIRHYINSYNPPNVKEFNNIKKRIKDEIQIN